VYYSVVIVEEERCDFEVGALRQEPEVKGVEDACHWIATATILVTISGVLIV
jgi:hypothetical protein